MRTRSQLLAANFAIAVAFSFPARAQERIEHPAAGIAVVRPTGWHTATSDQVQANRERARLADAELQQGLVTRSALPIIAFTKYEEPNPGLNPTVQITLRQGLAGAPTDLLGTAVAQLQRAFPDLRIVAPLRTVKVAGWPAAHVRVSYTLKSASGAQFPVLSRMWLIPRGRLMFLVGMAGAPSGADLCEDEFANVLASLEIAP